MLIVATIVLSAILSLINFQSVQTALFDFLIASHKGIEKFVKSISIFYEIFYWTDKVLGFIIFTVLIYYLESGYYETIKRLVDFFIRNIINYIKKKGKCKIIAGICVAVPVLGGIIALLVKRLMIFLIFQ